ncbi:MAG TPA: tetratricopeptide repeat protein [Rhodanobacteraceae bacterium]|nr:tetratricopeptide repeat protein [Rhodanobacteraceae bacterium]
MNLFAELRRRNVLRAAVLYAGAVWALAQGIAQLTPVVGAPEWIARGFLVAAAIGFPFWIAFAWLYEWTPQGFRREADVAADAPSRHTAARKLDFAIIGVLAVAVVLLASGYFIRRHAPVDSAAQATPAKSIAVLPFVNMSGDAKNDYFSDGITEEILNALAQIPDLKVAGRTSSFAFKGKQEDLRKIGEVLDVATVLEGSVQQSGDEVRITAQLIDTRSGYHLWSEKYDRQLTSIFAVEDEISNAIADKLLVQMGVPGRPLVVQLQVDPRAHDFYLRGLTWLAARSLENASAAFRQAVRIDSDYASAWGALAVTDALKPAYSLEAHATALPRAEGEAKKALVLAPGTPSAHVALGMIHRTRWQWSAADTAFRRALAIAPGDAEALIQYAQFLNAAGQFEAALREADKARALDPLSPVVGVARTDILVDLRRYADAAAQAQQTVAAHPGFALGYFKIMDVAIEMHRYRDAERYARRAAELAGEDPDAYAQMVRGVADPSQRAAALRIVESASPQARWDLNLQTRMRWLVRLGARDEALDGLERMAARHEGGFEGIFWTPGFDPVRNDPRFQAVLEKMGLPYVPEGERSQ